MQADDLARPARAKIFFSLQQLAATRGARNRPTKRHDPRSSPTFLNTSKSSR